MLSDDELKLKAQILSFRRQMVRLRSDSHWLSVPGGLRGVLAASFGQAEPRVLARIIGFPIETIARLKRKREQGGEKKRRTPLRYVPVIDLMRQHPGMGPMQIKDSQIIETCWPRRRISLMYRALLPKPGFTQIEISSTSCKKI